MWGHVQDCHQSSYSFFIFFLIPHILTLQNLYNKKYLQTKHNECSMMLWILPISIFMMKKESCEITRTLSNQWKYLLQDLCHCVVCNKIKSSYEHFTKNWEVNHPKNVSCEYRVISGNPMTTPVTVNLQWIQGHW